MASALHLIGRKAYTVGAVRIHRILLVVPVVDLGMESSHGDGVRLDGESDLAVEKLVVEINVLEVVAGIFVGAESVNMATGDPGFAASSARDAGEADCGDEQDRQVELHIWRVVFVERQAMAAVEMRICYLARARMGCDWWDVVLGLWEEELARSLEFEES